MNLGLEHINNIAITRNNTILMDGAGSQIQRNYCTYALARFLNSAYVHSPLKDISYHGLSALEKNEKNPEFVSCCNEMFAIPSDLALPEKTQVYHIEKPNLDFFQWIKGEAKKNKVFHFIKIGFPYLITDKNPQALDYIKEISPFESSHTSVFKIAIHVRRGELFAVDAHRMLPNSYYVKIAQSIIAVLNKLGIPFICELHTELPSRAFTVTPTHHGIHQRIQHSVMITQEMSRLEDFDILPNVKKLINGNPLEALRSMATADLLIISRSSFSYLAGLLNQRGLVVYHPFWHSTPFNWLNAYDETLIDQQLCDYCIHWQKEHA